MTNQTSSLIYYYLYLSINIMVQSNDLVRRSLEIVQQSSDFDLHSNYLVKQKSNEFKMILADNENFEKKSSHSTATKSYQSSEKNQTIIQFIKISNDKRKSKGGSFYLSETNNIYNYNKNSFNGGVKVNIHKRIDKFGTIIKKGGKDHKVSFKDNFIDRTLVESYKEINNNMIVIRTNLCNNCACLIF